MRERELQTRLASGFQLSSQSFEPIDKPAAAVGVECWQLFLPDRRPAASVEKEIKAAIEGQSRLAPEDFMDFLRALRAALRKLDRRSAGRH